jgi:hypothetical protein
MLGPSGRPNLLPRGGHVTNVLVLRRNDRVVGEVFGLQPPKEGACPTASFLADPTAPRAQGTGGCQVADLLPPSRDNGRNVVDLLGGDPPVRSGAN